MKRLMYMMLGGLLALVLVFGTATFAAQSGDGDAVTTPEAESEDSQADEDEAEAAESDDGDTAAVPGFGWHDGRGDDGAPLAEALGITVEELAAAYEEAWTAALDQAVADGLLTQEQANELLLQGNGGFRGFHGLAGSDSEEYLADALGITVEELQAAKAEVTAARLAELVEAGVITQEQADLAAAQQAVQNYVDREGIEAAVQSAYETAIEQAVTDGAITQAQADQLLENLESSSLQGFGFGGGFGGFGRGGHHHGGGFRGGPGGGFGFPGLQDSETVPAVPDTDA